MAGRKKKVDKMSVEQLQSYLKGIVDISDDDWHPTKAQWDNILELIMNVKEPEPVEVVREVVQQTQPHQQQPYHPHQPHQQQPHMGQGPVIAPSSMDTAAGGGQPQQEYAPAGSAPKQDLRKQQEKQGAAKVAEGGQVKSSGVTIVTRNKEAEDTESDFL